MNRRKALPGRWLFLSTAVLAAFFLGRHFARQNSDSGIPQSGDAYVHSILFRSEIITQGGHAFVFGNPASKRLRNYVLEYGLSSLCADKYDVEKAKCLGRWVRGRLVAGRNQRYPPWDASTILERTKLEGLKTHCGQYGIVFAQTLWALGIPSRHIDLKAESGDTHFSTAFWSKKYKKWVMMDASEGVYFERNGIPLDGLELHDIVRSKSLSGLKGISIEDDMPLAASRYAAFLNMFYEYSVVMRNNHWREPVEFKIAESGGVDQWIGAWSDVRLAWHPPLPKAEAAGPVRASQNPLDFRWNPNPILAEIRPGYSGGDYLIKLRCLDATPENFEVLSTGGERRMNVPSGKDFGWSPTPERPELIIESAPEEGQETRRLTLIALYASRSAPR